MARSISFDKDLAEKIGINAAIVYNELSFWNGRGERQDGWIYKTYQEMTNRLPLSERTIRAIYRVLEQNNLITTKIMKVAGIPVLHYQLCRKETANLAGTRETANLADSSILRNSNTTSNGDKKSEELLAILNRRTGRTFRVLPRGTAKTLSTFSLEEIDAALGNLAEDDWHSEKIGELSSDYLLRASTIDKFLNIKHEEQRSTAL